MSESENERLKKLYEAVSRISDDGIDGLIHNANIIADHEDFLRLKERESCKADDLAKC